MNDIRGMRSVEALRNFSLEGNIVPMEWYKLFRFENDKPDHNAIIILADIVYWHRPTPIRSEETGMVVEYRKKFKGDLLQKSYQQYADLFGLSKKQVTDAIIRLEEKGIIERVFRTIETSAGLANNVLFIALDVEKLKKLQTQDPLSSEGDSPEHKANTSQGDTYLLPGGQVPPSRGIGVSLQGETYTYITTNTTTERDARARATPPPSLKNNFSPSQEGGTEFELSETWVLPNEWREDALEMQFFNEEIDIKEKKFKNHFRSTTTMRRKFTQSVWREKWKVWCLEDMKRAGRTVSASTSSAYQADDSPTTTASPPTTSSDPFIQRWYELRPKLDKMISTSWTGTFDPVLINEKKAIFKSENPFCRDYVETNFKRHVSAILELMGLKLKDPDIEFLVKYDVDSK